MNELIKLIRILVDKEIVTKHDIKDLIKNLLTVGLISLIFMHYMPGLLDKREAQKILLHDELVVYRSKLSPKIDSLLRILRTSLDADRAFMGEYSNSTMGLTGLPYLYFSILNEDDKPGVAPIGNQYQKQSTSNFKFNGWLYENDVLTLDSLEGVRDRDPLTYLMLKQNGVKQAYLYAIKIRNSEGREIPKAFIGVTFTTNEKRNRDHILYRLSHTAGHLTEFFAKVDKAKKNY